MNTEATEIKSQTLDITNLATKADFNTKTTEIENEISDTTGFIATPTFNKLTKTNFNARIKQETRSFANKSQVDATLDIASKNK